MEQGKPYPSSLSEKNFLCVLASFRQSHHIPFEPVLVIESSTTPYGLGLLPKALDAMGQRVLFLGYRLMLFQMKNNPKLSHSVGECAGGNDGERRLAI